MPKYIANCDTWLSHECRLVRAGDKFDTKFPDVGGKPMSLGDNLAEVDEPVAEPKGKGKKADDLV